MGLFDKVYVNCPKCGLANEFQSKGDMQPLLRSYTIETAPTCVLNDALNKPEMCSCGEWLVLYDPEFPVKPKRSNPAILIVKKPKKDGAKWWPDGEVFEIIATPVERDVKP